jgi:ribose 5-phosphate isomerase A
MAVINPEDAKRAAAARALELVKPGMRLGLGTGTTAKHFVDLLGAKVAEGLEVLCVPTSERTRMQAQTLSIPLATLDEAPELDLTIDGADEFDAKLRLVKGGGGAHWREKIVATASKRMVVITDHSKSVAVLGKFPLPVEVGAFGFVATQRLMEKAAAAAGCQGEIRMRKTPSGHPVVSDNGNYLVDCFYGAIPDPEALALGFSAVPGVIEHGLFIGIATAIICAGPSGIDVFGSLD